MNAFIFHVHLAVNTSEVVPTEYILNAGPLEKKKQ